jgi:biotin carboxyl carrier protein
MAIRRLAKGLFGVGVLGVGGWTMVDTYVGSEGAPAVINSEVLSVRAPRDGYVSLKAAKLGSMVRGGDEIGELLPAGSDVDRTTKSNVATLNTQIASMEALVQTLREQTNAYHDARVKQLELEVLQSEGKVEAAKAEEKSKAAIRDRQEKLLAGGFTVKATLEAAREASNRAELEREAAEKEVETRKLELAAARQGTFVGDGYNDSFYSRQRADEIALRLIDLKADLSRQQARLNALKDDETGTAANAEGGVALHATGTGRIWTIAVNQGQFVRRGDTLLNIADCGRLFADASGAKREYAEVRRGEAASFHLDGQGSAWAGIVSWAGAAGQGILAESRHLAFRAQTPEDARYSFMVTLDDTPDLHRSCPVGAAGRVTFGGGGGMLPVRFETFEGIGRYISGMTSAFMGAEPIHLGQSQRQQ